MKQRAKPSRRRKTIPKTPAVAAKTKPKRLRSPRKSVAAKSPIADTPATSSAKEELIRTLAERLLTEGDTRVASGVPMIAEQPIDVAEWPDLLQAARQLIYILSDFDAKVEFLRAKERLERIYRIGLSQPGGLGASVAAQKELNRLLSLFVPREQSTDDSELAGAVVKYLHPLRLGAESLPPAELIRLAASKIMELAPATMMKVVG